jgi:hypothetical protein
MSRDPAGRALIVALLAVGAAGFALVAAMSEAVYWTTWSLALDAVACAFFAAVEVGPTGKVPPPYGVVLGELADVAVVNAIAVPCAIAYALDVAFDDSWRERCDFFFSAHFVVHFLPALVFLAHRRRTRRALPRNWKVTVALLACGHLAYEAAVDVVEVYTLGSKRRALVLFGVYLGTAAASL